MAQCCFACSAALRCAPLPLRCRSAAAPLLKSSPALALGAALLIWMFCCVSASIPMPLNHLFPASAPVPLNDLTLELSSPCTAAPASLLSLRSILSQAGEACGGATERSEPAEAIGISSSTRSSYGLLVKVLLTFDPLIATTLRCRRMNSA